MRVGRRQWRFPRDRDERGAVAVIVAICLILMFGMAAFAIDTGNLWQKRRGLIQATDSAALAAAASYGNPQDPNYLDACGVVAPDYVTKNDANATMTSCENHSLGDGSGYVTVNANTPVHFTFAPVVGIGDRTVASSSTAAYGKPKSVRGLRPPGLCSQNPRYADWLASSKDEPLTDVWIPFNEQGTSTLCNDNTAGNWSYLILDGGTDASNTLTQVWFQQGCQCLVDAGAWLYGTPGGGGGSYAGFIPINQLIDVPVYDNVDCSAGGQVQPAAYIKTAAAGGGGGGGGGRPTTTTSPPTTTAPPPTTTAPPTTTTSAPTTTTTPQPTTTTAPGGGHNCQYHVIGFVGVIITQAVLTGNPANRGFFVTFVTHITTGECCASGGTTDTGERVVFMCAVDATFDPANCAQP